MESLLVALTKCSIKDLEKNDFQYADYIHSMSNNLSDSSSENNDDENDFDQILMKKDYDSMKYSGQSSVDLSLFNNDLFKIQSTIPWPGREDITLKLMSQDELLIVRTEKSPTTGKSDMLLDIGLSMGTFLFNKSNSLIASPKRPSQYQNDKIIDIYFSHIHPLFPIVHKEKFLKQYRDTVTNGKTPSILIQSVLALTFRFVAQRLPDTIKDADKFADFYFRKVMKRLRNIGRSRLCYVQAALLVALYLDTDDGDVESIQWLTVGIAIRMAQDLGLHRSCSKWKLPRNEIETRHRVFYACYVIDRWFGAKNGKPLTILDRDFDTDMPSPYEMTIDDTAQKGPPIHQSFILLIKLSEILGRILKSFYSPNAKTANSNIGHDDSTILAAFERRLENWKISLDEPLNGVYLSELDKVNLNLFYNTVVLLLYRPFSQLCVIKYPNLKPNVAASNEFCTNAANQILNIIHQRQFYKSDPAYYQIFFIPSLYIYALFQSSLVCLYNVLQNQSIQTVQILYQSIDLLKIDADMQPASRAVEILHMLISINGLNIAMENNSNASPIKEETTNTILSPTSTTTTNITPSTSTSTASPASSTFTTTNPTTYNNSYIDQTLTEHPKSKYIQRRMTNTGVIGGITPNIQSDLGIFMTYPYEHKQPIDTYSIPNCPIYNNNNGISSNNLRQTYSHQRSISLDQLNHHHHHSRPTSQDCRHISNISSRNTLQPLVTNRNMNVNCIPTNECYTPQLSNNNINSLQQTSKAMMNSSFTSLPLAPQSYTAVSYDSNVNASNTTLPPSSLNWTDWDIYIGHQNNLPTNNVN
ncbi:fungal-specific transcription factor domain-containing protein [Cokeromyces recurvatus]|uniref:fungal-specific transcription factor domain-containing protein n=1 Tax=Cokeromyces recurvatus TaxID=90255 RepID=UPI00221E67FB|nr:fungal-specific transcription factor domain-containing protein [Cokeromyces recurvatus]KAI7902106.1 fungal-specific transcription factor domain-containing protein [Cokeromyces recurvatus]